MRKLPDWLQQDEALAASSKSHQYLQMNINSLRRLLGKMKQTTPALKKRSSVFGGSSREYLSLQRLSSCQVFF